MAAKVNFQLSSYLVPNDITYKQLEWINYIINKAIHLRKEENDVKEAVDTCLILQPRLLSGIYYNLAVILLKIPDYPSAILALDRACSILKESVVNISNTFSNNDVAKQELKNIKQKYTSYQTILKDCYARTKKLFLPLSQQILKALSSTNSLSDAYIQKWMELKQKHPRMVALDALPLTLIPFLENCKNELSNETICQILQKQYQLECEFGLLEVSRDKNTLEQHNLKLLREQSFQSQNLIVEYLLSQFKDTSNIYSKEEEYHRGLALKQKAILIRLDESYSLFSSIDDEINPKNENNPLKVKQKDEEKEIKRNALKSIQESVQVLHRLSSPNNKKRSLSHNPLQLASAYTWLGIICLEIGAYSIDPFCNAFRICQSLIQTQLKTLPNQKFSLSTQNNHFVEEEHDCKLLEKQYRTLLHNQKQINMEELYEVLEFITRSFELVNEEVYNLQSKLLLIELLQCMYIIPYSTCIRDLFRSSTSITCKCSNNIYELMKIQMDEGILRVSNILSSIGEQYNQLGYSKQSLSYLQKAKIILRGVNPTKEITEELDEDTEEILISSDESIEIEITETEEDEDENEIINKENDKSFDENDEIIEDEYFLWLAHANYFIQQEDIENCGPALEKTFDILSSMENSSFKIFQLGQYNHSLTLWMQQCNKPPYEILQTALQALEYKKESLLIQSGYLVSPDSPQASYLPLAEHPHLLWRYIISIVQSYEQLGILYDLNGQPDYAEKYYNQGWKTGKLFHLGHITSRFLLRLGELQYKQHQWDKAQQCFEQIRIHLSRTELYSFENDESSNDKKKPIPSALSSVSPQYRHILEILVSIRQADLIFKQQQSIQKDKIASKTIGIYYCIPKKEEKKILLYYQEAKNLISLLQSSSYQKNIHKLIKPNLSNNGPQTPEKSLYQLLTSPHTPSRTNTNSNDKKLVNEFWKTTCARIKGKLARLELVQGRISEAKSIWRNALKETSHPILQASFALSLAKCYLFLESTNVSTTAKKQRGKLSRCNTAPTKSKLNSSRSSTKRLNNDNNDDDSLSSTLIENAKKYLCSAYELVRNLSPVTLTREILQTYLLCIEFSKPSLSIDDAFVASYLLNTSLFISTRHKICTKIPSSSIIGEETNKKEENIDELIEQLSSLDISNSSTSSLSEYVSFENIPSLLNIQNIKEYMINQFNNIPKEWTICNMALSHDKKYLYATRIRYGQDPICIRVPFDSQWLDEFECIMKENQKSMLPRDDNSQSKEEWWDVRKKLDNRLGKLLFTLQNDGLGFWKTILRGIPKFENPDEFEECIQRVLKRRKKNTTLREEIIRLYMESFNDLSTEERSSFFKCNFKGEVGCQTELQKIYLKEQKTFPSNGFHPTILLLDSNLHSIPWESMPILYFLPISRVPSLSVLHKLLYSSKYNQNFTKSLNRAYYLVNPNDDPKLHPSQERFTKSFEKQKFWEGNIGKNIETQSKLVQKLENFDLYIYCGHGSSEKYMDRSIVEEASNMPVSLLMGCSSGKMLSTGEFDPTGFILSLLVGGSSTVVAYLWDVTDRDCDIICARILRDIVRQQDFCEELVVSSRKNTKRFTSFLNELKLSNIKPPSREESKTIISSAALAKRYCYLPFLNGSALISYGLPLQI